MKNKHNKFKKGIKVKIAECYLIDEINNDNNSSAIATVFAEPKDNEMLVGVQYASGELDYVPQDILEVL